MNTLLYTFTSMYVISAAITIAAMYRQNKIHYIVFKTLTGILFTGIAVFSSLRDDAPLLQVLPFFLLCLAGDLLLALSDEIDIRLKDPYFSMGVLAFAAAHVFLICIFGSTTGWDIDKLWIIIPAVILLYMFSTFINPDYNYGSRIPACCIYTLIISLCGGMGADFLLNYHYNIVYLFSGIGSMLFMLSDFILSNRYFRIRKRKWYGFGVLTSYYGAVFILALFIPKLL